MKKPDLTKRSKGKSSKRTGKMRLDFGIKRPGQRDPDLDGIKIKAGTGGITLPDKLALVRRLALDGYTDAQLARISGVSEDTLKYWRAVHPEFDRAIESGRTAADADVVASLYQLATGYDYEEEQVGGKDASIRKVKRHQPPQMSAIKFWLQNRRPNQFKPDSFSVTGKDGKPLIPKESNAELIKSIVSMIRPKKDG